MYICDYCSRSFVRQFNYERHMAGSTCSGGKVRCPDCSLLFSRRDVMERHRKTFHVNCTAFACGICPRYFGSLTSLRAHREKAHVYSHKFALLQSAHRKQSQLRRYYFGSSVQTVDEAFVDVISQMEGLVATSRVELTRFKISFTISVEMYRTDEEGNVTALEVFPFRADAFVVSPFQETGEDIARAVSQMDNNVQEFLFQGSGWRVLRPFYIDAELVEVTALSGAARCRLHIATFARGRGLVPDSDYANLHQEGYCFYEAVAAYMLGPQPVESDAPQRWYADAAGYFGGNVEVSRIDSIEQFWREQGHDLAINVVFRDEDHRIMPVRASKAVTAKHQIVLLLSHTKLEELQPWTGAAAAAAAADADAATSAATAANWEDAHGLDESRLVKHYSLVSNPEALFAKRVKSTGDTRNSTRCRKRFVCWNCANSFWDADVLTQHQQYCFQNDCQQRTMPKEGETWSFFRDDGGDGGDDDDSESSPRAKQFKAAYCLFFDFEALHAEPKKTCSCPAEVTRNTLIRAQQEAYLTDADQEALEEYALEDGMEDGQPARDLEAESFLSLASGSKKRCHVFPKESLPPNLKRKKLFCHHKTKVVADQQPFAYCYYVIDRDGKEVCHKVNVCADAGEQFLNDVLDVAELLLPDLTPGTPLRRMPNWQQRQTLEATVCYLCGEPFDEADPNYNRVLDHDHLNGDFLGVAHNMCNLHRKEEYSLSCFSHNLCGYDSHFLLNSLSAVKHRVDSVKAIPLNTQKFKTFTLNRRIKFLDSAQFLHAPLAACAETLAKSGHDFPLLDSLCDSPEQKALLLRKGVYPYSFATSVERLSKARKLPPRSRFYNELTDTHVAAEDYQHAEKVWDYFEISSMLEYTVLYLRTDTLLLAQVMMEFRENMWSEFRLDVCKYLSLPHLAKDIMLKTTGVELGLIYDQEMADLVQKNLRGGLSFINKRLAEKVSVDHEGSSWGRISLLYLDANNLYGKAMTMALPLGEFSWVIDRQELASIDLERDIDDDADYGYFFEVDLEYPDELHKEHSSFPLAPETVLIDEDDLSPYSFQCLKEIGQKKGGRYKAKKLTATMRPRTNYLVHGMNLKLYLKLGLKLVRIHRAIRFRQSRFVKPYIDMCTSKRQTAGTEMLRNLYKLLCNSLYGKFIEGFEKRMDCRFNYDRTTALRHSSSPLFKGAMLLDEDLSVSFLKHASVKLKQSWAVGFSVLELSKYWMQKSFYEDIQPVFQDNGKGRGCRVVMSDTDSLLLEVPTASADLAVEKLMSIMDTSNYDKEHPLYSADKAKQVGYFKNEVPMDEIVRFVGLKSKTYAFETLKGTTNMRAKGVPERTKHKIPVQALLNCLTKMQSYTVGYHALRSVDHINQMVFSKRIAFSSFDDKKYLLCAIHSAPYGSRVVGESVALSKCLFCRNSRAYRLF